MTLQERIKQHEGLRLEPYKDSRGYWTIGYGHKLTDAEMADMPTSITLERADELFDHDFAVAYAQAGGYGGIVWRKLNETRRGVLAEMVFQLGIAGVLKFKKMWAALDKGDYADAAKQMRDSLWHEQTPARCDALATIMERGDEQ